MARSKEQAGVIAIPAFSEKGGSYVFVGWRVFDKSGREVKPNA